MEDARRERALKRVSQLKKFYSHLSVYIIINLIIFSIKAYYLDFFNNGDIGNWLQWHIISTPLIWGIFLLVHAIKVFSPFPRNWEKRQIQKYIDREEQDIHRFN